MSFNWQYQQPAGPTLDITKKATGNYPFPYFPDERTEDEIQQEMFDNWQQQYEYEEEQTKLKHKI